MKSKQNGGWHNHGTRKLDVTDLNRPALRRPSFILVKLHQAAEIARASSINLDR
jgi:hypothetical protein